MAPHDPRASPQSLVNRHLERLRRSLDLVGERLQESIADVVGRSMAEGVSEAVRRALATSASPVRPLTSSRDHDYRPATSWRQEPERPWWRDDEEPDAGYPDEPDNLEDSLETSDARHGMGTERWARAVATALQAAAWWLRRNPERASVLAAFVVGLTAGLVHLVAAASVAGLVASAIGLVHLADLMRAENELAG
jgi:hypothetical protein